MPAPGQRSILEKGRKNLARSRVLDHPYTFHDMIVIVPAQMGYCRLPHCANCGGIFLGAKELFLGTAVEAAITSSACLFPLHCVLPSSGSMASPIATITERLG